MSEEASVFPTDETLEGTLLRAHTFLKNATKREFFIVLQRVGFSIKILQQGLDLYEAAAGIKPDLPALEVEEPQDESTKARDFLDAWDDVHFSILKAFFQANAQSLGEHLFRGGLKAEKGLNSVLGVKTLVTRITKIRESKDPDRSDKKDADNQALNTLAEIGYNDKLWSSLGEKIEQVHGLESLPEALPEVSGEETADEQQRKDNYALYTWYWLWATVVSNRADVIPNKYAHRLGVKRPGRPKAKKEEPPTAKPTPKDKNDTGV